MRSRDRSRPGSVATRRYGCPARRAGSFGPAASIPAGKFHHTGLRNATANGRKGLFAHVGMGGRCAFHGDAGKSQQRPGTDAHLSPSEQVVPEHLGQEGFVGRVIDRCLNDTWFNDDQYHYPHLRHYAGVTNEAERIIRNAWVPLSSTSADAVRNSPPEVLYWLYPALCRQRSA